MSTTNELVVEKFSTIVENEKRVLNKLYENGEIVGTDETARHICMRSFTAVEIPNGEIYIGNRAFQACGQLTSVKIPKSVLAIGEYAFYGTALTDVYYEGTSTEWASINISSSGNSNLTQATIHYNSY